MQRHFVFGALTAGLIAIVCPCDMNGAGPNSKEEAAIRRLIEQTNQQQPALQDSIFWSGAYMRPRVLPEKGVEIPSKYAPANRVAGSQKNKVEVIRIVVAESGDLAYEYSKGNLQFDLKTGEHFNMDSGILRVWQKDGGEWKRAAIFTMPYDFKGILSGTVK